MIPGTRVVHAEKTELTGVVREYDGGVDGDSGDGTGRAPSVHVKWSGEKGSSWIPIDSVVALEMEEAVADREWFSCQVKDGDAVVRMGPIEVYGQVVQSEVHMTAFPDRTAQITIVVREPETRGIEDEKEAQTFEHHEPDVDVKPPTYEI